MKLTNVNNLPAGFVAACESHQHERGENLFSVTELLKGECEMSLSRVHGAEATQDVADMVWAIFGTATHSILEQGAKEGTLAEHKMRYEIMPGFFWTGICDLYDPSTQTVEDFKTASIWKFKMGDYQDWHDQLRDYCCLLELCDGIRCRHGRIIALLKDHSKTDASRDSQYPQLPCQTVEFNFSDEEIAARPDQVKAKILAVNDAVRRLRSGERITPCSEAERWAKPMKWAVMKEGRKSAVRLLDRQEEADVMASNLGKGHFVEQRPGVNTKCDNYCLYKAWCPLFKEEM